MTETQMLIAVFFAFFVLVVVIAGWVWKSETDREIRFLMRCLSEKLDKEMFEIRTQQHYQLRREFDAVLAHLSIEVTEKPKCIVVKGNTK